MLMYIFIIDLGLVYLFFFEMEGFILGEKMGIVEIDKVGFVNVRIEVYVWKRFQERYFNFFGYIVGSFFIEERMRVVFSEMIMGDFMYFLGEFIFWYRDGVLLYEYVIYKKVFYQIVLYIVYKDGIFFICLSSIFDDMICEMYSGKFRMGVFGSIRKVWSDYEENVIFMFVVNVEEWKVFFQYKLYSDYLRIGVILLFMMLFLFMFIVLNIVKIFKGGLVYGFVVVSVVMFVFIEVLFVF